MPVDDLHDFFMEMVEDVREPYDTPGCLSFEAFMKRLGIGDSTPLQSKLFEQLDLNASGEIDFQEFLWGAWHFSLLQSDDSLVRFLFDLYEEKGIMRWSKVHECIMDVNGPQYHSSMWHAIKKQMSHICKEDTKCSRKELMEVKKHVGKCFLPITSLRDELRASVFGDGLWFRAYKIRQRTNDVYRKSDIDELKITMMGLSNVVKEKSKNSKIPVKHRSEYQGQYKVGRSTVAKAYSGESSIECKGRAKIFAAAKEVKVIPRHDKDYREYRDTGCSIPNPMKFAGQRFDEPKNMRSSSRASWRPASTLQSIHG